MSSIYRKGAKFWMRLKDHGVWIDKPTRYKADEANRAHALKFAELAQKHLDQRDHLVLTPRTVAEYATVWL